MNKFLGIVLSVLVLFGSVTFVSAENLEYVEHDSPYCEIEDSPTSISLFSNEQMAYTRMTYYSFQNTPDGEYYQNGNYAIGQRITSYYPDYTEIFFINDDGVLFQNPGSLSLLFFAHGNSLVITTYFDGGGSKSYTLDPKLYDGVISCIIENYEANIKSIRILLEDHNPGQYTTPTSVLSLDAYAYEVKEFTLFDVIVAFFNDFFSNEHDSFLDALGDFFGKLSNISFFRQLDNQLENTTSSIIDEVGSVAAIQFNRDLFDNVNIVNAFKFISPFLLLIFTEVQFSVIFYISCTLLLVAISLGFARHWSGGKK